MSVVDEDLDEKIAIRQRGGSTWSFYDRDNASSQIIDAEPNDILIGTRDSIFWQVVDQNPTDDPDYSKVFRGLWAILVFDEPVALDYKAAMEKLRADGGGEMLVVGPYNETWPDGFSFSMSSNVSHPCGLKDRSYYVGTLSYDLKGFVREQRKAKREELRRLVSRTLLWKVLREMDNKVPFSASLSSFSVGESTGSVLDDLMNGLDLFNWCFGKNAHRQLETFQILKNAWANNLEKNEKKILDMAGQWGARFIEWMKREVGLRKPRKRELRVQRKHSMFRPLEEFKA